MWNYADYIEQMVRVGFGGEGWWWCVGGGEVMVGNGVWWWCGRVW